jgi:hypothetical protein
VTAFFSPKMNAWLQTENAAWAAGLHFDSFSGRNTRRLAARPSLAHLSRPRPSSLGCRPRPQHEAPSPAATRPPFLLRRQGGGRSRRAARLAAPDRPARAGPAASETHRRRRRGGRRVVVARPGAAHDPDPVRGGDRRRRRRRAGGGAGAEQPALARPARQRDHRRRRHRPGRLAARQQPPRAVAGQEPHHLAGGWRAAEFAVPDRAATAVGVGGRPGDRPRRGAAAALPEVTAPGAISPPSSGRGRPPG